MGVHKIIVLLIAAGKRWWGENTFRLGASLAFYTVFSLAPLVLLTVSVGSLMMERQQARQRLLGQVNQTMGSQVGEAIESTIENQKDSDTGVLAAVVSVVVLLFGASTVFVELQDALNTIWGVKAKESSGLWALLRDRLWSFTVVLGIGFLLLVSLVLSSVLSAVGGLIQPSSLPASYLWQGINWVGSFLLITLLFALIYKLLPDVKIEWGDVWIGAAVTAFLFSVGKYLIGLYLGQSSWISAYGAAGSLVLVLVWVYYSSQIFLFGAEFTYVFAAQTGKPLVPESHAEARTTPDPALHGRAASPVAGQPSQGTPWPRPSPVAPATSPGSAPTAAPAPAAAASDRDGYWLLPGALSVTAVLLGSLAFRVCRDATSPGSGLPGKTG